MGGKVRAIGYVRRSKESGERTVSLAVQRAAIERYAQERGWELAEMVEDDGVSGGRRSRLGRLAERIAATGAKRVITYNLDRFARDCAAMLDTLAGYARRGVELHVVGRGCVERETPEGSLIAVGVEALMAEHYRRTCGVKTAHALAALKAEGRQWTRIPPYGYVYRDGRVVEHQDEQRVIAQARALREEGLSLRAVSEKLASRGIMARNGKRFAPQTLAQVLTSA